MDDLETSGGAFVTNSIDDGQILGSTVSRRTEDEAERRASLCQSECTCSTDSCAWLVTVGNDDKGRVPRVAPVMRTLWPVSLKRSRAIVKTKDFRAYHHQVLCGPRDGSPVDWNDKRASRRDLGI